MNCFCEDPNKELIDCILDVINNLNSLAKFDLHKECLILLRHKYYDLPKTIDNLIIPNLKAKSKNQEIISSLRYEALLTISTYKLSIFNSKLM